MKLWLPARLKISPIQLHLLPGKCHAWMHNFFSGHLNMIPSAQYAPELFAGTNTNTSCDVSAMTNYN
jgi:hypothetical protein